MTWFPGTVADGVVSRIIAAQTLAANRVQSNRDTPVPDDLLPFVAVFIPTERSALVSKAGSEPLFLCDLTLHIEVRTNSTRHRHAETGLYTLVDQVKTALLTDPTWVKQFEQIAQCTIDLDMDGSGQAHTANARITFVLQYHDDYPPNLPTQLSGIDIYTDAIQPFDPDGTYTQATSLGFPAAASAPRTSGPDGRIEIGATINVPTD